MLTLYQELPNLPDVLGQRSYYSLEGADNGGYDWDDSLSVHGLRDQDIIHLGNVQLKAIHTRSHSRAYVL